LVESVVRPVAQAMQRMVRAILTQAAGRGEIREDLDLEAAVRAVNVLLVAVGDSQLFPYLNAYFQVSDQSMPLERVVDGLVALVLQGIASQ
jgi:hypothetical protein